MFRRLGVPTHCLCVATQLRCSLHPSTSDHKATNNSTCDTKSAAPPQQTQMTPSGTQQTPSGSQHSGSPSATEPVAVPQPQLYGNRVGRYVPFVRRIAGRIIPELGSEKIKMTSDLRRYMDSSTFLVIVDEEVRYNIFIVATFVSTVGVGLWYGPGIDKNTKKRKKRQKKEKRRGKSGRTKSKKRQKNGTGCKKKLKHHP